MATTLTLNAQGQIHWNGKVVSRATLDADLLQFEGLHPLPVLLFRPDPDVPCDELSAFRRYLDTKRLCRTEGLCGEGTGWAYFKGDKVRL